VQRILRFAGDSRAALVRNRDLRVSDPRNHAA
jgi:hypothetical protein